jgi:hypothetical protein
LRLLANEEEKQVLCEDDNKRGDETRNAGAEASPTG